MNFQVIASPDGTVLWVSGALPGSVHDLTAARIWGILDELAAAGLIILADKGYTGAGDPVLTPYRGRNKPASQKQADRAHARLCAPGERANAQLKTCSRPAQDLAHHAQAPLLPVREPGISPRPSTSFKPTKWRMKGSLRAYLRHSGAVGIDSRVVALAVLAVLAAVGLGFWAGTWAGVAAALAGLVPAVLWEIMRERRERNAAEIRRRESALRTFATTVADSDLIGEHGAAWYLRPEAEVVAFHPRPELGELREWCVTGSRLAVRLVAGEGGAGKTRLAIQLGQELTESGWRSMWIPQGQEMVAIGAVRNIGEPTVLVVDYAETRAGLASMLAEAMTAQDTPELRVILLARSTGEWWQQLLNGAEYQLTVVC